MKSGKLREDALELNYAGSGGPDALVANALRKHADYVAHAVVQAFTHGNVKDVINTLQSLYTKAVGQTKKQGVRESSLISVKSTLKKLIAEAEGLPAEDSAEKTPQPKEDKPKTVDTGRDPAAKAERDIGDILYHMDMGTRHIDVLQDYEAVMPHRDELASIASSIQALAQRIRQELSK